MIGENCFARCWYSGCSLIVHSIKYILFLFLCVGGCLCSMLGMGPGLVSMSPLSSINRCEENVWFIKRFFCFLYFVLCLLFIVLWSRFVMWFEFLVVFCVCLVHVILVGFFLLFGFECSWRV